MMIGGKDGRAPATNPVKIRVLYYLGKSIIATNLASHMIQVVFDGIYGKSVMKSSPAGRKLTLTCHWVVGESSNTRLRRSTMAFLQWSARMVGEIK